MIFLGDGSGTSVLNLLYVERLILSSIFCLFNEYSVKDMNSSLRPVFIFPQVTEVCIHM